MGECERVSGDNVDEEILLSLMSLGWGQDDEEVRRGGKGGGERGF